MDKKYIIGIDGGSQSSKVIIFDLLGNVVCQDKQPLMPMYTPEPGVAEHPSDDLYDSIVIAASRLMKKFDGNVDDIVGIGLCTIRCCRCLTKVDGTLAQPAISWMDQRLAHPYVHENPEVAYVTTTSGYIMGRLTDNLTDTIANYIGPWPMDVKNWCWFENQALFDSFNVPKDMLYKLQMPGEIGGYVNETFSKLTGIPQGIPVVHTANDKAAEALGTGLIDETTGLVSLGTYIAGMIVGQEYVGEPQNYFSNFASVPHKYLYESGGIRRGMWTVTWLKEFLGKEVVDNACEMGINSEDYLNNLAAKVPAGSDGLMCVLDWLAPPSLPYKKGMFLGFDERHTYAYMYRSILEGIAYTMKRNFDAMTTERNVNIEKLIVSGGGAYSDLFMQIFADVFGIPTVRNVVKDAAGLGSAICAAVACGVYSNFDEAIANMVRIEERFEPIKSNVNLYAQLLDVYCDITKQTDWILERTYNILQANKGE